MWFYRMLTVFFIIYILTLFLYYFIWPLYKQFRAVKNIPSADFSMFPGFQQELSVWQLLIEHKKKYERFFKIWMGPKLCVVIYTPEDVEIILKSSNEMKKAPFYNFFSRWLGNKSPLLIDYDQTYIQQKKLLMAIFHTAKLHSYLPTINKLSEEFCDNLKDQCEREFDVEFHLRSFIMQTILETLINVNSDKNVPASDILNYLHAEEKVIFSFFLRIIQPWLYPKLVYNFSKLKQKVDENMKTITGLSTRIFDNIATTSETKQEFFSELLKNWKNLNIPFISAPDDIRFLMVILIFGGQDTTSTTLGFTLSLLGIHQDIQERVFEEILQVFGKDGAIENLADARKLPYTEQVIKEAMRLFPSIPVIGRTLLKDINLRDGQVLPKNSSVMIPLMLLHRCSQFDDPEKFNPDNFSQEKEKNRHPYAFVPFSSNHRACFGGKYAMLLMKVFLVQLLRKFKVHSRISQDDFQVRMSLVLKRKGGFRIQLEKREY